MTLKVFEVSRTDDVDWDEYRSAAVLAADADGALQLIKDQFSKYFPRSGWGENFPDNVEVIEANLEGEPLIICLDFNAG